MFSLKPAMKNVSESMVYGIEYGENGANVSQNREFVRLYNQRQVASSENLNQHSYMRHFKFILVGFFLLALTVHAQSERDSVEVYGNVMADFTYEKLKGVRVEIMRADSSLITEFLTDKVYRSYGYESNIMRSPWLSIPRADCIFRFSKEGYVTKCVNIRKEDIKKRATRLFVGEVLLKKKSKLDDNLLGEATVTASKIQMVVKGDTLVYNADAFQLSEGSMLDGLIKMLPGFELENGQIRVNGQYVSSLLVNGEDFFKGDPRVALENLPAYMVSKVKVYRKEHVYSYITKEKDKNDLPLVVDVNLKREYAVGWVANAEAGYGLEDRYLARLFGLRFTDNSRLAVYGNANNTNDTREPGTSGNWQSKGAASGRTEMQTGGFEAFVKDKKGVWKYTGNAKVFHQDTDNRSETSAETFLPGAQGSTFSRSRSESLGHNFKAQTMHQFEYKKPSYHMTFKGDASFQRRETNSETLGAEFSADPDDAYRGTSLDSLFFSSSERLTAMLINRRRNRQREFGDTWNGRVIMRGFFQIPDTPDYLSINANAYFYKQDGTTFSDYALHNSQGEDKRQRYIISPSLAVDADFKALYCYRPDWCWLSAYYEIKEVYNDTDHALYRLDKLGAEAPAFGALPSTTAALMATLDAPNSYTSELNTLTQKLGADWTIWLPGDLPSHRIKVQPELTWRTDRLTYHRDVLRTKTRRDEWAFTSQVSWGFEGCYLNYYLDYAYPDPVSLLDYADDADPLNLYKGNPDLKRSTNHRVTFQRSLRNREKDMDLRLNAEWNVTLDAIAHAMNYDAATGVRTYSPRNVDGNWGALGRAHLIQALAKKKQIYLTSITELNFRNSVDYVTERSSVQNFTAGETLRLNMRIKKHSVGVNAGVKYLRATSARANFADINSFDFSYGVVGDFRLPADFLLSTGVTMYHRRGYSDASMNDNRLVADVHLSKPFMKNRLTLSLDACDIFRGQSNVTKVLNAQGLTETWYNTLPTYVMLRLTYKISKQPKKK